MNYSSWTDSSLPSIPPFPGLYHASPPEDHETPPHLIFRNLSRVFPGPEMPQRCDLVKSWPQEAMSERVEHERLGIASFSTSEQLSPFNDCLSQSFTTPWPDTTLLQAQSNKDNQVSGKPGDSGPNSSDYALPPPTNPSTSATKSICIACDKPYKNLGALKRHQCYGCERTVDWVCWSCPNHVFDDKSKLEFHHYSAHADTCLSCLETQTGCRSDTCKEHLSQSFSTLPVKKAWGCPCCIQYFDTLSAWNQHSGFHPIHNRKVQNWSFSTMIRSLFHHRRLTKYYDKYELNSCHWAYLEEEDEKTLRYALERHVLPSHLVGHHPYSHLTIFESLALYASKLGTTIDTCAEPATIAPDATAIAPALPYGHAPTDQFLEHQPLTLTPLPQGSVETSANFWVGQHDQHHLPSSTSLEVATYEELEPVEMESRSASGAVTTWQFSQNKGPQRLERGPATHDTYAPYTQSRVGKARTRRKTILRGQRQTLTTGDLRMKPHY